jgi:hypothetical protein
MTRVAHESLSVEERIVRLENILEDVEAQHIIEEHTRRLYVRIALRAYTWVTAAFAFVFTCCKRRRKTVKSSQ